MAEQKIPLTIKPVDESSEEIVAQIMTPSETPIPDKIITTNRKTPIKRHLQAPLTETHGMTTEAERFKDS